MSTLPRALLHIRYGESADAYMRNQPLEKIMEATPQATQRKITLESLDLVHARRPDVQTFNELLVQYPLKNERDIGKVVPDNMIVVWPETIVAEGSFDLPFQPTKPFWVLEYVSKSNKRKDYEESFEKYERHLKVPYYLVFFPDVEDVTLYRHTGRKYVSAKPNDHERYAIKELEMEIGLLDGWVRFWYQETLLPLPAELQKSLDEATRQLEEATQNLKQAKQDVVEERQARLAAERELAELREQMERLKRDK